ncbi:MAG: hypothetical protein Q7S98_01915, partial [Deltaproteobacteria bacterium]|nr:hypothetical protein [Deltaproteobacteria bacterium]
MACNPVSQSCPPEATDAAESVSSVSAESQPAAELVIPSAAGGSEFVSAPRADQSLAALSERVSWPIGPVEATRTFLNSWSASHPVAPGVRYPVLSRGTAINVHGYVNQLPGSPVIPVVTTTNFGRHWRQSLTVQKWLRDNPHQGPFRALVVGAGFGNRAANVNTTMDLTSEAFAVLEWASILDQAGLDFRLDVVDLEGQVEAYFKELSRKEEHTFVVSDFLAGNERIVVPETFAPQIFGRYAREITASQDSPFPAGVEHAWRVTLPKRVLERIRFVRGNLLGPLPDTGYDLMDCNHVSMYLPDALYALTPSRGGPVGADVASLALNLKPGGWLVTDRVHQELHLSRSALQGSAQGYAYQVGGFRDDVAFLERQPDGSWQEVTPLKGGGNGTGGGVSYRGSEEPEDQAVVHSVKTISAD